MLFRCDARRCRLFRIEHHVFNLVTSLKTMWGPYVRSHAEGLTPNPCIECNRHLKFDKLIRRAKALGFNLQPHGHHARIVEFNNGYVLRGGRLFRISHMCFIDGQLHRSNFSG